MQIENLKTSEIVPYENNPRKNDGAVDYVANSIKEFGFKVPIVIDSENVIVCGHTRLKAALKLGLDTVPCVRANDLTPEQVKAFRLADNKTGELAEWDDDLLEKELEELADFDFQMNDFGFELETLEDDEDDENEEETETENEIPILFQVVVDCESEIMQKAVFDKLAELGYDAKLVTLS